MSLIQSGPGIVRADLQTKARAAHCDKGMGLESTTHLAMLALCQDPGEGLAMLAAMQRRGISTQRDELDALAAPPTSDGRTAP